MIPLLYPPSILLDRPFYSVQASVLASQSNHNLDEENCGTELAMTREARTAREAMTREAKSGHWARNIEVALRRNQRAPDKQTPIHRQVYLQMLFKNCKKGVTRLINRAVEY